MKFLTDGGFIYYEITDKGQLNDGKPVMFFIPGGPGFSFKTYKELLQPLEKFCHIIYHDPRGCGNSSEFPIESYTIETHIADIENLRKHLGYEKIVVLGFSYGSMVALGYAIKYSTYINHLILAAGATSHEFLEKAKKNLIARGTKEQNEICDALLWNGNFSKPNDMYLFMKIMLPMYSFKANKGEVLSPSTIKKEIPYWKTPLNYAFRKKFFGFNYENKLSNISCKTLIMSGTHDWINDPCFAKKMATKIPYSELILFEKSGHSILTDARDDFFKQIIKRLNEIKSF